MNPCPFCSKSKGVLTKIFRPWIGDVCVGMCLHCGCRGPEVRVGKGGDPKKAMSKALIKWNERKA